MSSRDLSNVKASISNFINASIGERNQSRSKAFNALLSQEENRKKVVSQSDEDMYRIIWHYHGTIFQSVVQNFMFWLAIFIHIISRLIVRIENFGSDVDYLEKITEQLGTIGTILFFFLPFYVSQNYTRYYKMHGMTVTIINCIETCAVMAQAGLSQVVARRIIRYINASHLAFYTALSDSYTKENFFEPVVERFSLLNQDEINLIYEKVAVDNFGATICNEIISWVLKDCKNHNDDGKIQVNVISLRNTFNQLFLEKGRPIPFFYIHFLNTMVAVYLPAYSLIHALNTGEHDSWDVEFFSLLVLFVKAIYVLGILDLGRKLADPYGEDVVDINIVSYVITCIENCFKILCADAVVRNPDHSVELKLKQSLESSGCISHVFKISDDLLKE